MVLIIKRLKIKMENQKNNYYTSDIKIASFLLSKGISLIGVERPNLNKVVFIFEKEQQVLSYVQDYLSDKAIVNPRVLFESFNNLKRVIYKEIQI